MGSGALLEPKLFQGFDELIPVVARGVTRVNGNLSLWVVMGMER